MAKKNNVKKAVESIVSGDARALRRHIKEALLEKVKRAINIKEKALAKTFLKNVSDKQ